MYELKVLRVHQSMSPPPYHQTLLVTSSKSVKVIADVALDRVGDGRRRAHRQPKRHTHLVSYTSALASKSRGHGGLDEAVLTRPPRQKMFPQSRKNRGG